MYVDEIIITSSSNSIIQRVITHINSNFTLKQLGSLDCFLGIEVHLLLCLIASCLTHGSNMLQDLSFYRPIIGALHYVTITCPKLSSVVNKVCWFMDSPLESNWVAVKRLLRYLKPALHCGLIVCPAIPHQPPDIRAFCDADWAANPNERRTTSVASIYLGPNLVSWWQKNK